LDRLRETAGWLIYPYPPTAWMVSQAQAKTDGEHEFEMMWPWLACYDRVLVAHFSSVELRTSHCGRETAHGDAPPFFEDAQGALRA
jgi:hypothetical protein